MLEMITGFLLTNIWSVGVVVIFIVAMGMMWFNGYKKNVALVCLELIAISESRFSQGQNMVKLNAVIDGIYNQFPVIVKIFVTRERLIVFINKIVADSKSWLQHQAE